MLKKWLFLGTFLLSTIYAETNSTIKVLQYNMKYGKPGQLCCNQTQGNQVGLIEATLSGNDVDFACLTECQSASDDKSCIKWSIPSYDFQCHTCPGTTSSYNEALTLIYNTNRYTFKTLWSPTPPNQGCCAAQQLGRGFMAIALTEKSTGKNIIFIGIHPDHGSHDPLLDQIAAAIQDLGGSSSEIILAGDINYQGGKASFQENSDDFRDSLSKKLGTTWSNISNLIQCGTNNSNYNGPETFDNVFINQTVNMVCEIPTQYVYQTDPNHYSPTGATYHLGGNGVYSQLEGIQHLGDARSEEHIPLLATITLTNSE
ncbi:MAG: hypothetical protein KFB93_03450 [Simkaniaceae bacterium]|nr:MAG: hypothetical protein KFB93_03450 [Simkaniaceae bacterium]